MVGEIHQQEIQDWPVIKYQKGLAKLKEEYSLGEQILYYSLKKAQMECQHGKTTYHPDPSGNNDSYTECDLCGKEIAKPRK
jgi:hypothetical protein